MLQRVLQNDHFPDIGFYVFAFLLSATSPLSWPLQHFPPHVNNDAAIVTHVCYIS